MRSHRGVHEDDSPLPAPVRSAGDSGRQELSGSRASPLRVEMLPATAFIDINAWVEQYVRLAMEIRGCDPNKHVA